MSAITGKIKDEDMKEALKILADNDYDTFQRIYELAVIGEVNWRREERINQARVRARDLIRRDQVLSDPRARRDAMVSNRRM